MFTVIKQGIFRYSGCWSQFFCKTGGHKVGSLDGAHNLHSKVLFDKDVNGKSLNLTNKNSQPCHRYKGTSENTQVQNSVSFPSANVMCVRCVSNKKLYPRYYTYRHSAWKRIHRLGLEARLSDRAGKEILWRNFLKGRQRLTTFDRILDHNLPRSNEEKKRGKQLMKKLNQRI